MNRVGQPVDIARVVCFLASQDGEWVNGKVIGIDGAVSGILFIRQPRRNETDLNRRLACKVRLETNFFFGYYFAIMS